MRLRRRTRLLAAAVWLPLFALTLYAKRQNRPASQESAAAGVFPLEAGTYWIYQGTLTWAAANANEPQELPLEWKMTVDRVVRRSPMLAAVISGFPRELDGANGAKKPSESLIVQVGTNYYWIPPDNFAAAMTRLQNPKDNLDGLVTDDEQFLDLPLVRGKKFCNAAGMVRSDHFYCWVAGEPTAADLSGAKGIPAGDHTEFPVAFLTMEDSTSFVFVPGIGITRYRYQRQGAMAETELYLAEFHRGAP